MTLDRKEKGYRTHFPTYGHRLSTLPCIGIPIAEYYFYSILSCFFSLPDR